MRCWNAGSEVTWREGGVGNTLQHAAIGRLRYGVDMGRHLVPLLAAVHVHDGLCVDGQVLVGVDHHAEEPRVRLQGERESRLESVLMDRRALQKLTHKDVIFNEVFFKRHPGKSLKLRTEKGIFSHFTVYYFILTPSTKTQCSKKPLSFSFLLLLLLDPSRLFSFRQSLPTCWRHTLL